jgi:hypothetical protein
MTALQYNKNLMTVYNAKLAPQFLSKKICGRSYCIDSPRVKIGSPRANFDALRVNTDSQRADFDALRVNTDSQRANVIREIRKERGVSEEEAFNSCTRRLYTVSRRWKQQSCGI